MTSDRLLLDGLIQSEKLHAQFDDEEGVYEQGHTWKPSVAESPPATNEISMTKLGATSPDERLHLRLPRQRAFVDDAQRRHGLLMHELLSGIRTHEEIAPAVSAYQQAGDITRAEADLLTEQLHQLTHQSDVSAWFSGQMRVMNEVEILFEHGQSKRPDRMMFDGDRVIVVDYKFGAQQETRYLQQVEKYTTLIRKMGYPHVEGYIWYVMRDELIACDL